MSAFGDNTAHQDMLERIQYVQNEFSLTDEETIIVLYQILGYYLDFGEQKSNTILKDKKRK